MAWKLFEFIEWPSIDTTNITQRHNDEYIKEAFTTEWLTRGVRWNQTQYQFESINLAATTTSHLIFKSKFIIIIIGTPEKNMLQHTESDLLLPFKFIRHHFHSDNAVCTVWKRQRKHSPHCTYISSFISLVVYWNIQSMCLCGNRVYFSINDFRFSFVWHRMKCTIFVRSVCHLVECYIGNGVVVRALACLRLLCLLPQNKLLMHIMVCFARTLRLSVCVYGIGRTAAAMKSESFSLFDSILLSVCAVVATTVSISTVDSIVSKCIDIVSIAMTISMSIRLPAAWSSHHTVLRRCLSTNATDNHIIDDET